YTAKDGVIFHVTAHQQDADYREILNKRNRDRRTFRDPVSILLPKIPGWTDQLYSAIAEVVHGDRIRERFLRLFGQSYMSLPVVRGRFTFAEGVDPTQELTSLAKDIEHHYKVLDPDLKKDLEQVFTFIETDNAVRVSLF